MCIGLPMRVVENHGLWGVAEGRGRRRPVSLLLTGEVEDGSMVLVHNDDAVRILDPIEAADIDAALDALEAVLTGVRGVTDADAALAAAAAAARWREGQPADAIDLATLSRAEAVRLDDLLGKGEVSATVRAPTPAMIEESAYPGVWRVRTFGAGGMVTADRLEVGDFPAFARRALIDATRPDIAFGTPPEGAGGVLALLMEIRHHLAAGSCHVIALSHLPMTPPARAFLLETLGSGPITIRSEAHRPCVIEATGVRGVWLVRYTDPAVAATFIEVGDIPAAALAAGEDVRDSAERLRA